MIKMLKRLVFVVAGAVVLTGGARLLRDSQALEEGILRLHVVANSDSQEDQAVKLSVRDAVTELLEEGLDASTLEEAKVWIQDNLPKIEAVANRVLAEAGTGMQAVVSLAKEEFPTRIYDTFQLPAGLYEALRITIGEGEGQNWWCVVFPTLCVPASSEGVREAAEVSGMSQELSNTLTKENTGYEIRFRLLDWLGTVKNWMNG